MQQVDFHNLSELSNKYQNFKWGTISIEEMKFENDKFDIKKVLPCDIRDYLEIDSNTSFCYIIGFENDLEFLYCGKSYDKLEFFGPYLFCDVKKCFNQ